MKSETFGLDWSPQANFDSVRVYMATPEGRKYSNNPLLQKLAKDHGKTLDACELKQAQIAAVLSENNGMCHVQLETLEAITRYARSHRRHDIYAKVAKFRRKIS